MKLLYTEICMRFVNRHRAVFREPSRTPAAVHTTVQEVFAHIKRDFHQESNI